MARTWEACRSVSFPLRPRQSASLSVSCSGLVELPDVVRNPLFIEERLRRSVNPHDYEKSAMESLLGYPPLNGAFANSSYREVCARVGTQNPSIATSEMEIVERILIGLLFPKSLLSYLGANRN